MIGKISISWKLLSTVAGGAIGYTCVTLIACYLLHENMVNERIAKVRALSHVARGVVSDFHERAGNGQLDEAAASLVTLDQLAHLLHVQVRDFFDDAPLAAPPVEPMSEAAMKVRNATLLLPDDDLEVLAGLADVLDSRRRRKRG